MIQELVYVLRLVISAILGFAIGFERKARYKEAGVRTHTIVTVGSCIIMLVSKYGFEGADSARVAAQIVSGIGFIGAGMIVYKRQAIQGLTTAAGIWTTAGVGMAVGAGMYVLAVVATVLIIVMQCVMHLPYSVFKKKRYVQMKIVFICRGKENETIKNIFEVENFTRINVTRNADGDALFTAYVNTDKIFDDGVIREFLTTYPFIQSIERATDDET